MPKCDVLSLELYSLGRDIDIVEPILIYLEYKYSLKIARASGEDYGYYLLKYRPKLLLISNSVGSAYKTEAVKLASLLGIKVVSLVSEGQDNCRSFDSDEVLSDFYWGTNKEKKIYEDLNLVWNDMMYGLESKILSKCDINRIKISGSTLMDKYFILRNTYSREDYIKKNALNQYNKVVLITTWSFSLLYGGYYLRNSNTICGLLGGEKYVEFHKRNAIAVRKIYEHIIKNNKDILFIIKIHPAELDNDEGDATKSEYYGLDRYNNVHMVAPYTDSILDLLSISDILLSYESTTAMEAWLLDKPAIFVNPETEKFPRNDFYKGVVINKNAQEVMSSLKEFYNEGHIKEFDIKEKERKHINAVIMKYADGKNHIRAANMIIEILKNKRKKKHINLWVLLKLLKGCIRKVMGIKRCNYNPKERMQYSNKYREALLKFYEKYSAQV